MKDFPILGTGPGRCGTRTLAEILSAQKELCPASHEEIHPEMPFDEIQRLLEKQIDVSRHAFFWADELLRHDPKLRLIYLKRKDRHAHLLSLFRAKEVAERNGLPPYALHDPKQTADSFLAEHDRELKSLQSEFFDRVLVVTTEELGAVREQQKIAKFLNVRNWTYVAMHKHSGGKNF